MFKHLKHIKLEHIERVAAVGEKAVKAARYVVENQDEIKKKIDAASKATSAAHEAAKQGINALRRRFS